MGRPAGSKNKGTKREQEAPTVMSAADFEDAPEDTVTEATPAPQAAAAPLSQTDVLMAAVQALVNNAPVRRVGRAQFKTHSPFNPTGNKRRKLSRRCYQNGFPMDIRKLHDAEITLLNQLEPGRYIEGLVRVLVQENGSNTDLHIVYKNKEIDDRLALKSHFRNLKEMLQLCVDEAKSVAV